jgi:hypothetical protein
MVEFDSPIGKRNTAGKSLRTFEVGNDPNEEIRIAEEIKAAKMEKNYGILPPITPHAKERAEFLLNLTRKTKEFEVDGVKFILQTLKTKEWKYIRDILVINSNNKTDYDLAYLNRFLKLSLSLVSINNISFNEVVGSNDINEKMNFLEELQDELLTILEKNFDELVNITKASNEIKNEDDVKEVVSDLKK